MRHETWKVLVASLGLCSVLAIGCSEESGDLAPTDRLGQGASSATAPSSDAGGTRPSSSASSGRPFKLYTHCGVEYAQIRGQRWHADPPRYNRSGSSPPAGWGDPYQRGTLVVESSQRAVFKALGQVVIFVPAPENEPVRMCD